MVSNRVALIARNGWKAYAYYLLFPLDLFGPDSDARLGYQQAKISEVVPVYAVLLPLIVLATASINVGAFSLLLFFSVESLLLALLTTWHLKLARNQAVELWLNAWLGLIGIALVFALFAYVLGGTANPTIDWG